ncbi:MAG: hypothetical protein FWD78_10510 [Treponema sp.]|nr:hypothetical protein [Treponema sp.]
MKYFVCSLTGINLGIPAEKIGRISDADLTQKKIIETINEETVILIPALFGQAETAAPHALHLKNNLSGTILLTPKIDIDLEIPDSEIKRLPAAFAGVYTYISGVCFESSGGMVLILNPDKLAEMYAEVNND